MFNLEHIVKPCSRITPTPLASAVALGCAAIVLVACGGGSGSGGTGAATPSATYSSGRISGFGSIVVNKVHYKEDNATIQDEDGDAHRPDELKLGMVIEVHAGEVAQSNNKQTSTAQNITFSSLIVGPIDSVGTGSIVVLGQTVKVDSTTVFDDSLAGGLAALKPGVVVRVYGTPGPVSGAHLASRLEPQPGAQSYRLRGAVSSYDTVAKTITIGAAVIDVSAISVPDGVKAGALVRLKLQTTKNAKGAWVATSIKLGHFETQENDHAEVEGTITDFSSAKSFTVNGMVVDASGAVFERSSTALATGVRVEVEGAVHNGVLVATKVELKTEEGDRQQGFDVEGAITTVGPKASTFVVHGVTVTFNGTTRFVGGTASDLTAGVRVDIQGSLASDGVSVAATQISIMR